MAPHHSQQHRVTQDELLSSGMQRTPELPRGTDRLCLAACPKGENESQKTGELRLRATTSQGIRLCRLCAREPTMAVGWLQHGPTASQGSGAVPICQGHRAGQHIAAPR